MTSTRPTLIRTLFAALLVLAMGASAVTFVGCGGNSDSQSAASEQQASSDSADDEQDNCYGDDLPAKKS